jgi:penicillin-binding protein 1A
LIAVLFAIISSVYLKGLPSVTAPLIRNHSENTLIYSRNGTLIDTIYGNKSREYVTYNQISPYMIKAMIAAEDIYFFEEKLGIDPAGIIRAAYHDIFHSKSGVQGGSTITQQLIKNTVLTNKKKISRKIRGLFLTLEVSSKYSKKQIMQAYLNDVSFGGNIYGIQMAAETYFGIPAKDLNIAQSALLAGLVQAPGIYSPFYGTNPKLGISRQHYVLSEMIKHSNIINIPKSQIKAAESQKLVFHTPNSSLVAPWFVYYVKSYLDKMYGYKKVNTG